jgi:hypothetical protein
MSAGALRAGKAIIEFVLSDKDVAKGLKAIEHRVAKVGQTFMQVGTKATAMGVALGAPLLAFAKRAADAREALAKFKAVFGEQAAAADAFAQSLADSLGRSVHGFRSAMSAYQAFFVGLGFGSDKAREMTEQLTTLATDFAAFHNIDPGEAMGRFISAMSGSSEVLDQFGVNIKASAIDQKLLALGIDKTTANATEQEKAMARLAVIAESMGAQGAIGAAAREADSFANRSLALRDALDSLAIEIGEQVLPRVLELTNKGIEMAEAVNKWAAENPEFA